MAKTRTLIVAGEAFPLAKTGGLGDAITGMARALMEARPMPVCTVPCSRGGAGTAGKSCTSLGKMTHVTLRRSRAMRMARSTIWRACSAVVAICT